jgi:hypothetical protein
VKTEQKRSAQFVSKLSLMRANAKWNNTQVPRSFRYARTHSGLFAGLIRCASIANAAGMKRTTARELNAVRRLSEEYDCACNGRRTRTFETSRYALPVARRIASITALVEMASTREMKLRSTPT